MVRLVSCWQVRWEGGFGQLSKLSFLPQPPEPAAACLPVLSPVPTCLLSCIAAQQCNVSGNKSLSALVSHYYGFVPPTSTCDTCHTCVLSIPHVNQHRLLVEMVGDKEELVWQSVWSWPSGVGKRTVRFPTLAPHCRTASATLLLLLEHH